MRRDMDLIRDVLIAVSDNPKCDGIYSNFFNSAEEFGIPNRSTEEVAYHVLLLMQSGYLSGNIEESFAIPSIKGLTFAGHEFLDDIRDQEIWNKTKERAKGIASVGLSFIWEIAKAEIRGKLHLP